jgi:hypothetical protein
MERFNRNERASSEGEDFDLDEVFEDDDESGDDYGECEDDFSDCLKRSCTG